METVLGTILSYLISLAANVRTDAIIARREESLKEQFKRKDVLSKALASTRSLREELRTACIGLARDRHRLGVTPQEGPLWRLLSDDVFQADLVEWFQAGGIVEGKEVKERLLQRMETALAPTGASPEQIAFLRNDYFDAVDKAVFANPILANWRHQLSLDYLRELVVVVRRHAEEAAGIYAPEKQQVALDRYCERALAAWDIIDLSNLPEGDIHMATQKLLLRQLYMPLRINVEPTSHGESDDAILARVEEQRETRRHWEAGHLVAEESDVPSRTESRIPVGRRLGASHRLIVLGDPGGGKTTMLRWMATAYLLRHKGDDAFSQIPDAETLPSQPWVPVLIRCRDLGEADLCRCFTDFLTQHLNKTELLPEDADVMRAVILDRIAKGEVLLLVDGLDEITNPLVRMMFCQELERTTARYPDVHILVTSRIVGYRDMPYRMGPGFEHSVIAELNRKDKDLFAQRWIEVTEQHQPTAEKAKRVQELLDALHSSDRIERLTGNPMLLTTLALVKRKVGKLPNRRNKLYAEAVSVLLNWNPRFYQAIEEDEAIPQLEYLAYEMCRRGVQRLTDDEVLDLLDKLRNEYPNIRAIRRRDSQMFLAHLEARSSILIKSGGIWKKDKAQESPVWEFRHLTFQEYLAARALLDGRYPDRDKSKRLAEQIAPLAGEVEETKRSRQMRESPEEVEVPESWREALRLFVADSKDDDVDEVLLAILNPMAGEDPTRTERPRAVLAGLCLADEPNVSEEIAQKVLATFAAKIGEHDGKGSSKSSLDQAAIEIEGSMWSSQLTRFLIQEFCRRPSGGRWNVGGLCGMVEVTHWKRSGIDSQTFFNGLTQRLKSGDQVEMISAALSVMAAAFEGNVEVVEELPGSLLDLLTAADSATKFAAAWALGWLSIEDPFMLKRRKSAWLAKGEDVKRVTRVLEAVNTRDNDTRKWLVYTLGYSKDNRALPPLIRQLDDPDVTVRRVVIEGLGQLGDKQAVPPLLAKLDDPDAAVQGAVIQTLGQLGDKQAVPPLLAKLDDPNAAVRGPVIYALGQLGDKQVVPPLLAKLDDPNAEVRGAVIDVLGQLGDKQAISPLLAKMDDPDADVRGTVIDALGKLGDKQVISPLLAKLDDPDADVQGAVIQALGKLGDKQAISPLLAKLDDPDADVRRAVIQALGKLGDKQAKEPLVLLLDDRDQNVSAAAAAVLAAHGVDRGTSALAEFLKHDSPERRQATVEELVRARREPTERTLLSLDLDGRDPWLDPIVPITERRIADVAEYLGITTQEVRSRYESIAADFHLSFE